MLTGLSRSRWPLWIRLTNPAGGGLALALCLTGCHGVGRPGATPNRPLAAVGPAMARTALAPATLAISLPPELGTIDPNHSEVGTTTPVSRLDPAVTLTSAPATGASTPAAAPPPTPLLDAALLKAKQRGDLPDPSELAHPPATAADATPSPAPAAPGSPPAPAVVVTSLETPTLPAVLPASAIVPVPSPTPAPPAPEAKPVAPEDAWRDGVRRLVGLARARQEQPGAGLGEPWGLRARVLAWLAEPDIDPDLAPREADGVRSVLHALAATSSGPAGNSPLRGDEVRTAVRTLEAQAPLELVDLRLCSRVDGFGVFTPVDSSRLLAGSPVVLYVEVDGFHQELTPRGYHSHLVGRREIVPEQGGPSIALPLPPAEEILERYRRDYYVPYLCNLPADLTPGAYTLRLTLKDVPTERTSSRTVAFRIVADDQTRPHDPASASASATAPAADLAP